MGKTNNQSRQASSELALQLGERIWEIRKREGLSLETFALRCDMHPGYIGHIERGIKNPTLSTLERICKDLGISVEELFKDIDAPVDMDSAAIRHLAQVVHNLTPEQTRHLLQIVDSVVEFKNDLFKHSLMRVLFCCLKSFAAEK